MLCILLISHLRDFFFDFHDYYKLPYYFSYLFILFIHSVKYKICQSFKMCIYSDAFFHFNTYLILFFFCCLQADRPPSLLSSPSVRVPPPEVFPTEGKPLVPESPQPPATDSLECAEDRGDGGATASSVVADSGTEASATLEPCASSFPGWIKSPDRGLTGPAGLNFSPVNSNLRDLTPSHTLEPLAAPFRPEVAVAATSVAAAAGSATSGSVPLISTQPPFSSEGQGQVFYPASEEVLGFSRSLNADGGDGGGSAQNPPQKKKVRKSS